MEKIVRIIISGFSALVLATVLITGCGKPEESGGNGGNGGGGSEPVAVSGVTLNKTSLSLEVNSVAKLTATIAPDNATDKTLVWMSNDETIVKVDVNGNVTAVAIGSATITVKAGNQSATCSVTVNKTEEDVVKEVLIELYNAWDGPNWAPGNNWNTDKPLNEWKGVTYYRSSGLNLFLQHLGLKGEIPECIGKLTCLKEFYLDEKGVTGKLPDSFKNLTALTTINIFNTAMTSLPDVFQNMTSLREVRISGNHEMTGPLPESIGSSPKLKTLSLPSNSFTGSIPESWARLGGRILKLGGNRLTGKIPSALIESVDDEWLMFEITYQQSGYGFDISDLDIHGWNFWPKGAVEDLDGQVFTFEDVVKKNKYTIYLDWAPWCPFSKQLLPQLKDYYEHYRQDGLEIIATVMLTDEGNLWSDKEGQIKEVREKGYDQWYNYFFPSVFDGSMYLNHTPSAEVYDSNGIILFSSFNDYYDPVRKRFGKTASTDLIPFLESLLGPAEIPDTYTSKDFSKDGQVMTLQKASEGKGIDIVFMGDAYTDKDMSSGGLYETVMKESMDEFFSVEPYKTFRKRFNVYAVKVVSMNGRIGNDYSTALGTRFGEGTYVEGNEEKCYEYAMRVPGISKKDNLLVCVMVNSRRGCGTTFMSESTQSSVAFSSTQGNDRTLFGSTLCHEAGGHGFAFLADEYATFAGTAPDDHISYYNSLYNKYGWFPNADFTSDPNKIHWSTFLSDDRYKNEVGVFEGGALYQKGAYRPTKNSMMNMNMGDFNAPSRWAVYKRIMELSGETASFDKFLEYDAVNRGKQQSSAPRTRSGMEWEPGAPPVIRP